MVRQVLTWRDAAPMSTDSSSSDALDAASLVAPWVKDASQRAAAEAAAAIARGPPLWRRLAASNAVAEVVLSQLGSLAAEDAASYDAALVACSTDTPAHWPGLRLGADQRSVADKLVQLVHAMADCRVGLRYCQMGLVWTA
jgi:hypothetical protein